MSKNILILVGGGGAEHEISKISAAYIKDQLSDHNIIEVEITKNGWIETKSQKSAWLLPGKQIATDNNKQTIDFVIPCLHGTPGETGEIQPLIESFNLPYLGCTSWTSATLFNKVTTKLWCDQLGIANTPYIFLADQSKENLNKAQDFLGVNKEVFIKAASQGSSIGCYQVNNNDDLLKSISEAFKYSQHVLIEKNIEARELEVAVYQYQGKWHISKPGEIITEGSSFYDYEEKYSDQSNTKTIVTAESISDEIYQKIVSICDRAISGFKLKHLSRVDLFLEKNGHLSLNEINTFPGMTPISLFPRMMEQNGHSFKDFLNSHLI